jgi:hypothetical protein
MNTISYKENEDTEWGWFIPLDINIINEKEEIKKNNFLKYPLNYPLNYYKKNLKVNNSNLKPIDENNELYENIYSMTNFNITIPNTKYKSYIDKNLINITSLPNYTNNNIIDNNNDKNSVNNTDNKNLQVFNILNCILIIKCSNIKYVLIRCIYYSSTYVEYVYKYLTSLLYPRIK